MQSERLLSYLQRGVDKLLEQGSFDGGQPFRKTQRQALEAYQRFLSDEKLSVEERLKGFFEIPTGVGKTAVFIGIVAAAHTVAEAEGEKLKTVIVVPTTQLLNQTKEAIEGKAGKAGFAPQFKGHIGLYGDGHKSLKHPLTIMTYEAWAKLSEAGLIGSHNVDIMISDEAHRGTSDNRILNIKDYFNERTAQIAFTATAHFDQEKSVQQSHEREIFYKPLPDAVREGELCRYIQSQSHEVEIEIPDDLRDIFNEGTPEVKTAYRKKLRQTMWNKTSLALFREGRDERTGDPLSDNKAGFFVEGIEQADELEDMLNADPVLLEKAKALGCEYVGLAIHSRISTKEQKRRHKLYEQGKVMAIIGDEQFKEGSDYPHMKTIFDTKHGSQVDKVQIIGRGARFWLNPEKHNRDEGLTFVDIITYFQADNAEDTEWNREVTLRTTIRAMDILQGDCVLSEASEKQSDLIKAPKTSGGSGGFSVHIDGAKVKSYVTLESLYELSREVSDLRESYESRKEDWIEITDEMRAFLNYEAKRTSIGSRVILNRLDAPKDLTIGIIEAWKASKTENVSKAYWDWTILAYSSLPDAEPTIQISEAMKAHLNSEVLRTGIGSQKITTYQGVPDNLKSSAIENWRYGTSKAANPELWSWVISTYALIPDAAPTIEISDEMRAQINAEIERTKIGATRLSKMEGAPESLNSGFIEAWRRGINKSAETIHWNWVIDKLQSFPNAGLAIQITEEMRQKLNSEMERTQIGSTKLLQASDNPENLKISKIESWRDGKVKTVLSSEWDWVINRYSVYPTQEKGKRIRITDEMRLTLQREMARTGVGPVNILKNDQTPEDLTPNKIIEWAKKLASTANLTHWNWVIDQYKKLPDDKKKIQITQKMWSQLEAEVGRTRVGIVMLLKSDDAPEGLTKGIFEAWRKKGTMTAYEHHWNWALSKYKDLPDALEEVKITEFMRQQLILEVERTGVSAGKLLKMTNAPSDLNVGKIFSWMSGKASVALKPYWELIINQYKLLPNKPNYNSDADSFDL